ncbi:hypothetical protein BJ508DRAFT_310928 [Ascobolus immersus RN42]|uniref:Uncharacterized protein n=1 Tax=Ascobolus immersus RN42 TaxID=1160509 RepID=A0A3N4HTJ6_ASCIM|nr:hypothetical protein BJ508DRAFT_310928 [Ascobolus immersus RN42]
MFYPNLRTACKLKSEALRDQALQFVARDLVSPESFQLTSTYIALPILTYAGPKLNQHFTELPMKQAEQQITEHQNHQQTPTSSGFASTNKLVLQTEQRFVSLPSEKYGGGFHGSQPRYSFDTPQLCPMAMAGLRICVSLLWPEYRVPALEQLIALGVPRAHKPYARCVAQPVSARGQEQCLSDCHRQLKTLRDNALCDGVMPPKFLGLSA